MESTDTKERENASMINVVVIIAITYRRVAGDTLLKVQGETVLFKTSCCLNKRRNSH